MAKFSVTWKGLDVLGKVTKGELASVDEGADIVKIEEELFKAVPEKILKLGLTIIAEDGSGHIRQYERRGETWVRTFADNLLPDWFPIFFFALMFGFPILLFVIHMIFSR